MTDSRWVVRHVPESMAECCWVTITAVWQDAPQGDDGIQPVSLFLENLMAHVDKKIPGSASAIVMGPTGHLLMYRPGDPPPDPHFGT